MKPWAEQFYKSKAWLKCRKAYITSVQGLCERCRRRGIAKPGKIVHHKTALTPDNITDHSISLNPANLEYLCQECHNIEHYQNMAQRGAGWRLMLMASLCKCLTKPTTAKLKT